MSESRNENEDRTPQQQDDEAVAPDVMGVGPREDDETVTAEDLVELKDDPEPMEPSG